MKKFKPTFSHVAILFILVWSAGTVMNYGIYKGNGQWGPFKHDQFAYYAYLPAAFVHHGDWDFTFTETLAENEANEFYPTTAPKTGKKVNKVTYGVSIMLAPAFFVAHGLTLILPSLEQYEANGYSQPYRVATYVNALLVLLVSLMLLRSVLKQYFEDAVVGFALLGVALGSNLFYYSVHEHMMSHLYSFFLYSLVIWITARWHESRSPLLLLLLGLVAGVIMLVRPTNIIILLLFVLYNIRGWADVQEKALALWKQKWAVLGSMALAFLIILPQLCYWKLQTGDWLFFSYGEEERFYWSQPAIWNGFFSYCKGWYIYSPIMLLATVGFIGLWKHARPWFWGVVAFFVLNVYVVLSWWSWWYGGGFGLRAFAESGAVMIFGLCMFIHWIFRINRFVIPFAFLPVIFCIFLNVFQTMQYKRSYIRWNGMTKERYWKVFMQYHLHPAEREEIEVMFNEPSR